MSNQKKLAQHQAVQVASLAVTILGGTAIWSIHAGIRDWSVSAPLVVFFCILTINTFFSIRYFHPFEPARSRSQWLINSILIFLYLLLETSFNDPLRYTIILTILFAIATVKYLALRKTLGTDTTIERKIRVDSYATLVGVVAVIGMFIGVQWVISWTLAIGNIVANIYLLWANPLYIRPLGIFQRLTTKFRNLVSGKK